VRSPWGGGTAINLLFQAGRYDGFTGLYAFGRRDYSPTLGRWMEQAPLGYAEDANLYGFVNANPVTSSDPSGLFPQRGIDLGHGYIGYWDSMPRGGGVMGGHLHVLDASGIEVAKVNERGGYAVTHKGRSLSRPSELPRDVRNNVKTIVRRYQRAGRPAFICGNVFASLGATAIVFAGATYLYEEYLAEGEQLGLQMANQVGLAHALQILAANGDLPFINGQPFIIERPEGNITVTFYTDPNGTWFIEGHMITGQFPNRNIEWIIPPGRYPVYGAPR
jgi:RHS repeat-associated protein